LCRERQNRAGARQKEEKLPILHNAMLSPGPT
jgi:hypothetical protein